MFNYLYYNIYVKKLSPSDRTYLDDLVYENNEKNSIDHIPIKRVNLFIFYNYILLILFI